MRLMVSILALAFSAAAALAGAPASPPAAAGASPPAAAGAGKTNANPCKDEVAAALKKLRSASWFRLTTSMITEKGPVTMEVDYVLPDRMRQKVTEEVTLDSSEVILVGEKAWGNEGQGWVALPQDITGELRAVMQENVVEQQEDVGNYSCKGRTQFEGRDVISYKLEDEPAKDSTAPKNETYRMFYVDATTGLPVSNALLAPGRETKPLFKASYSFPVDIKIDPPQNVIQEPAAAPGLPDAPPKN